VERAVLTGAGLHRGELAQRTALASHVAFPDRVPARLAIRTDGGAVHGKVLARLARDALPRGLVRASGAGSAPKNRWDPAVKRVRSSHARLAVLHGSLVLLLEVRVERAVQAGARVDRGVPAQRAHNAVLRPVVHGDRAVPARLARLGP
jgi:hypothetical protein